MSKALIVAIIVMSLALGLNAPKISAFAEEVIDSTVIGSNSVYVNKSIDVSVKNPNFPGYGRGISPNSVYRLDNVLTLKNNGSRDVCVVVESSDDHIRFYTDDRVSQALSLTLHANKSKSVGVEINSSDFGLGLREYRYSINVYDGACG